MIGTLGGPELPDDDALRRMVATEPTERAAVEAGLSWGDLVSFDAATAMDGLQSVVEPDSLYRLHRDEQQLRLGRGSGQLVLGRLGFAPEQFVSYVN